MAGALDKLSATLITRLEQRLRNQNEAADAVLQQIEAELRTFGTGSDVIIQEEYQLQGADDISVRNVINAMRLVSNINWADFVESVSWLDRALREHPGYSEMDFPTRDRYRRAVENLARRAPLDEIAVASAAVAQARSAVTDIPGERDPGHYLIAGARRDFGKHIGYLPSFSERFWQGAAATGWLATLA